MKEDRRGKTAFTILELIIAVAVIGVLVAVAVPTFNRIAARSKSVHCMSNLRQIGGALNLYLAENHLVMPTMVALREDARSEEPALDNTLDEYLNDEKVFRCLADEEGIWRETGTSYLWNSVLNGQPSADLNFLGLANEHKGIPVASDKEDFHEHVGDRVNILYADGHVDKEIKFDVRGGGGGDR